MPVNFSGRAVPHDVSPICFSPLIYLCLCTYEYSLSCTHNAIESTGMFVAQRQPLLMFAVRRGPCILMQCSAADFRFLFTLFKRGPRNIFFRLPDTCHIKQAIVFFFFLFLRTEVL